MANPNAKPAPAPAQAKESKKRVERTPEEKRANFHAAAPARVDRILKAVASLRSIARPVKYAWTETEHNKIFKTLADALNGCEQTFRAPGSTKGEGFTL